MMRCSCSKYGQIQRRLQKTLASFLIILVLNGSTALALHQAALKTRTTAAVDGWSPKAFASLHAGRFKGSRVTSPSSLEKKTTQSPLFQSSECVEAETYSSRRHFFDSENLMNLQRIAVDNGRAIPSVASALMETVLNTLRKCWWCLPMTLALVPPFCVVFLQTHPTMPSFWPLIKLDSVLHSPYAALTLGMFLLSNIAYFISGAYLFLRFHLLLHNESSDGVASRDPLLGGAVLTAGTVSTVFHSVQALGPSSLAESLCFIDHGVAISAVFYFFYRCGWPSRRTWLLSIAGLVSLTIHEGYAWLHSAWHLLSASAAIVWARDGLK